jgi:hypothetical protein
VVRCDPEERFSAYLPWAKHNDRIDEEARIPPNSWYFIRVTAPPLSKLPPYHGSFPNGETVTIELGGEKGKENDSEKPIDDEPSQLMARPAVNIVYEGRVTHSVTHEPLPGVIVYDLRHGNLSSLAKITPEQWMGLHALPPKPNIDDPRLAPIVKIYGSSVVDNVARTGERGHFRIKMEGNRSIKFLLFAEEDFLAFGRDTQDLDQDGLGVFKVPDINLLPAAKVIVEAHGDQSVELFGGWWTDQDALPDWARPSIQKNGNPYPRIDASARTMTHSPLTIHVPSNLNIRVSLRAWSWQPFCPAVFPDPIQLKPGQTRDLGVMDLQRKDQVSILVLGEDGQPLEGIPVYQDRVYRSEKTGDILKTPIRWGFAFYMWNQRCVYLTVPQPLRAALISPWALS